ncbi:MAG TPA: hypothetical protein PKD55_09010, partial [Bellilinea sp.]|nr:hypothetical protein [Bellilinea sp.]
QGVEYMFLARSNNHLGTLYHFKVGTGVVASNTTSSGGSTSVVVPSGAKFLMDSSTFKPGATIKFEVQGFPKSVDVDVQLRKVGASPAVIIDGKTDTEGRISKIVTIPSSAVAGEKWEIWVGTTQLTPGTAISSGAFTIQ